MMNTRASMLTCDNKLTTALLFEKFGLPMPKTAFISNENNIKSGLDMIGGNFPSFKDTNRNTRRRSNQNRKLRRPCGNCTSNVETRRRTSNTRIYA